MALGVIPTGTDKHPAPELRCIDPFDPTPVGQGIGVYYTNLVVGEVDFAIIEDRKFESGPKGKIP
ncbi:MAG: hypothetical protein KAR19_19800 [Bacteroidales bacterium]|nr:hypothetical protein [Bacteroidales bacterium]